MNDKKQPPRGATGTLGGMPEEAVAAHMRALVEHAGDDSMRWSDMLAFLKEERTLSEALARLVLTKTDLLEPHMAERVAEGVYCFSHEASKYIEHRMWRFPRAQLDLPSTVRVQRALAQERLRSGTLPIDAHRLEAQLREALEHLGITPHETTH